MRLFLLLVLIGVGAALAALIQVELIAGSSAGPAAVLGIAILGTLFLFTLASWLLTRTRFSQLIANVWLVCLSVSITYLVVDLTAGYFLIEPLSPPIVPDPFRHHRLVPDSYSQFRQQEFAYVQRVNNLGLRGADQGFEKPEGTFRILMLGDSFTMGTGVNDDQTFSVLIEKSLNRTGGVCNGKVAEVLNAGVDSYSPILSYIHFKRELLALGPDLVVLNLDMSDLVQESVYRKSARLADGGDPVSVTRPAPEAEPFNAKATIWIEKHMFLTRLLVYHMNRMFGERTQSNRDLLARANSEVLAHTFEGDRTDRDRLWSNLFDSISRLKALADEHSIRFVLSVYPWGHQVNEREWLPGRFNFTPRDAVLSDASLARIERFAAEGRLPLANLFPVFRSRTGGDALFFKRDMHFTPAGHELMAAGLERYLKDAHLLESCGEAG